MVGRSCIGVREASGLLWNLLGKGGGNGAGSGRAGLHGVQIVLGGATGPPWTRTIGWEGAGAAGS